MSIKFCFVSVRTANFNNSLIRTKQKSLRNLFRRSLKKFVVKTCCHTIDNIRQTIKLDNDLRVRIKLSNHRRFPKRLIVITARPMYEYVARWQTSTANMSHNCPLLWRYFKLIQVVESISYPHWSNEPVKRLRSADAVDRLRKSY